MVSPCWVNSLPTKNNQDLTTGKTNTITLITNNTSNFIINNNNTVAATNSTNTNTTTNNSNNSSSITKTTTKPSNNNNNNNTTITMATAPPAKALVTPRVPSPNWSPRAPLPKQVTTANSSLSLRG
eukprot:TRINITY_DN2263_c0_g6_i2.p3 TRINITY_DN2263_c0_g6~~TRINITY_DN2263_c0_g6_i2.p3  ORF type:complete len:126 (-),score=61.92 TRINITY_DN2263_c0_g6_i2:626-1003(-)